MQCSVCDSPLKKQVIDNIFVEYCKNCDGFWFDGNEVIKVLNYLVEHPDKITDDTLTQNSKKNLGTGYCPKCNQVTNQVNIDKQDFTFLKCNNCQGIWIDKSNLSSLLKSWKKKKNIFGVHYFSLYNRPKIIQFGNTFESYIGWSEDSNSLNKFPYCTILLIILNVLGFFILNPHIISNKHFLFNPSAFVNQPNIYWYTIITSIFMHADVGHLFGNMVYLYIFGNNIEDRIGPYKFFILYILLGIIASNGYALLTSQPDIPSLGASGAISGILGSYLLLYPKVNMKLHRAFLLIPYTLNLPIWFYLGVWFLGQQLLGVALNIQGIAWYAHICGFACGYVIMFLMKKLNYL
jgi:membrane associated rhomboid family serine protease